MAKISGLAVLLVMVSACSRATSGWSDSISSPKQRRVTSDLHVIATVIDAYAKKHKGSLPDSLTDLAKSITSGGTQCFYGSGPRDVWGNPYLYAKLTGDETGGFIVLSLGADGAPGGCDDDADLLVRGP